MELKHAQVYALEFCKEAFNRTIMELKHMNFFYNVFPEITFNRTIMELKHLYLAGGGGSGRHF